MASRFLIVAVIIISLALPACAQLTGDASVEGNLDVNGFVTAETYYGDGSNLTGIRAVFEAQDTVGGVDITAGWTDVPLDTEVVEDSDYYSHAGTNSTVTVLAAGLYKVTARGSTYVSSGTNRSDSEIRLMRNAVPLAPIGRIYNRNSNQGSGTATVVAFVSFAANDTIRVQARRLSGANTVLTLANGSSLIIELVRP